MTVQEFLKAVEQIAATQPVYREGGTGADGTCDCIGLVMGAMAACGHAAYDMHSSNYFARYQMQQLQSLQAQTRLEAGMVVYKARSGEQTLHERYLIGGRYHTGDLNDYYHAGVVESAQPLVIVHCTSTAGTNGIARDHTADGWTHCGFATGVEKDEMPEPNAVVVAAKGDTVNLRKSPRRDGALLARVPVGSRVTVQEQADGWARVRYQGLTGYMMEMFVQPDAQTESWVRLPRSALLGVIETLRAYVPENEKEEEL